MRPSELSKNVLTDVSQRQVTWRGFYSPEEEQYVDDVLRSVRRRAEQAEYEVGKVEVRLGQLASVGFEPALLAALGP